MQSAEGSSQFPAQTGSDGDQPAPPAEAQGENELALQVELIGTSSQPVFYRIDSTRISLVEYRWGGPLPLALLGWLLAKGLRVQFPGSTDDPAVESLGDFEVSSADVPAHVQERFATSVRELAILGFHSPVYHAIDDVRHCTRTYLASFAHPTRPAVARLHNRVWSIRTPAKDVLFTEFITAFPDGEFLWTLSSKADLLAPSRCRIARQEGATPLELWRLHEHELAMQPSGRTALSAVNREQVLGVCDRLHRAVRDFHLQRGVFAPLTPADLQRRASALGARQQAMTGGWKYPEILVELDRLQQRKTSSLGGLLILIVSLLLFLGVGLPGQSSFLGVLALVPILLFHECGHYLAMRASGYRNLRMFFIPGFGAAVSGRHFNVPGWKKVIVSLMGPVPGIVGGIVLGICGLVWEKPVALEAAIMVLILNGLNLVPVLPLDGGHVVHTVLFSRHYLLDITFRMAAALVLIVLAILTSDRLILFLAILMFVGLPGAIRVAQVARELRREGFVPASPDNQTIPPEAAEQIIAKLKRGTEKPQYNKVIAQRVLEVFETLNTRPPGWLASIVLLLVHVLSFLAAVVFAAFFTFALLHGASWDSLRALGHSPRHSLTVAEIRNSPASQAAGMLRAAHDTVVATFAEAPQALAAYDGVVPRLKPGETATLLGNSLLMRLSAADGDARKRWIAELRPRAVDVFVDGGVMHATFRFSGVAGNEAAAQAIVDELKQYFALPISEGLIAPWSLSVTITPEQRLARRTYARLQVDDSYDDPAVVELSERLSEAQRNGDEAEVKALDGQLDRLVAELRRKHLEKIADDESGEVDTAMARRYLELYEKLKPVEFYRTVPKELAPRLGQVSQSDGTSDPASDTTWARSGCVTRTGRLVQIHFVSFHDAAPGVTAFLTWLDAKGGSALRYEVFGDCGFSESEAEFSEESELYPHAGRPNP